jgi:hypothetical protein
MRILYAVVRCDLVKSSTPSRHPLWIDTHRLLWGKKIIGYRLSFWVKVLLHKELV